MDALRRRPLLVDAGIAALLVALAELEVVLGLASREPWVHAVVSPLLLAPLAFRRRIPLVALAAALTGVMVLDPEFLLSFFGAAVLAAYSAGVHEPAPRTYLAPALAGVPFVFIALQGEAAPSDLVAFAFFFGGPWGVGRLVRSRVAQADELVRLVERDRERKMASAVEAERARIARELHDIVSHAISVVTVQTQAVRRRLGPEHAREADDLRAVEATAREAMAEMRRLFGVLRAGGEHPSLAPQPGLAELAALLDRTRAAGLPVELAVEGDPATLPPGVDLAAFRVVQEALTNARRHAAASQAVVRLRYGREELEVMVEDDGRGPSPNGSGGHGLLGMRERVTLYGGTLETGAAAAGGFRIRATLPYRAAP